MDNPMSIRAMLVSVIIVVAFAGILEPLMVLITPPNTSNPATANFIAHFYGSTNSVGLINGTLKYNLTNNIQSQLAFHANQSTLIYGNQSAFTAQFGGFAFMILGIQTFYHSLLNFPNMIYFLTFDGFGYLPYVPIALGGLLATALLTYSVIGLVFELMKWILKVEIGQ